MTILLSNTKGDVEMFIPEKGLLKNSNTYFHTPSKVAKSIFFYMIQAGEFFCNGNYRIERNSCNSFLVMYVRSGSGVVMFNNSSYIAKANDVIILNCHEPHGYYTEVGWETLWVHFDGNASKPFFELLYNRFGIVLSIDESNVIQQSLSHIINSLKDSKPLPESVFSYYIHRMLSEMIILSSNPSEVKIGKINPVLDAINYIENNYKEKISLKALSAYVNISTYHFSRIFKKETGYSPYEYIIKTRIDKAKIMLKKTRMSIKEIAFEVGFNCESNFVDSFHRSVNQTPKSFRDTHL